MNNQKFKVVVMSREDNSYIETYTGISRIYPSYLDDKMYLLKDYTPEEMELKGLNPDEDEDFTSIAIDSANEKYLIVTPV